MGQFADPVHQFRHRRPELVADGVLVDAGVLDDVVQHGGHQALVIHVHVGEDAGDGEGVGDVGLAAAPDLAEMGLLGEIVGATHLLRLVGVQVAAQGGIKGINGLHGSSATWLGAPG